MCLCRATCAYVELHARNVNLRSRSGASLKHEDVVGGRSWGDTGQRFLVMEDGEDSAASPSQRTYLAESSAETSAERSRRLATQQRKKQRGQSAVEAKRARREQQRVQK